MQSDIKIIDDLLKKLFPICRSLSGAGNAKSFAILNEVLPIEIVHCKSNTQVFDWVIPDEWNINTAYIKNSKNEKIVDFEKNNLHVVNYSMPFNGILSKDDLLKKIYTLPDLPQAIPYRTSYYKKDWGFCIRHEDLQLFDNDGPFEVVIDSSFNPTGNLSFATAYHKGQSSKEILISTYCCHPSMANDNLSGLITALLLFKHIRNQSDNYYSYRLVMAPETIGVLCFLSHLGIDNVKKIIGGTVTTTTGGPGDLGIKLSFHDGNHFIDKCALQALNNTQEKFHTYDFEPDGSDERQYSTPGVNIPTISITKDKYYEYKEYHTSLDNLDFVKPEQIQKTLDVYKDWFYYLEVNRTYERINNVGEYQLGKRGLFPMLGGSLNQKAHAQTKPNHERVHNLENITVTDKHLKGFAWLMHMCNGKNDLITISNKSKIDIDTLHECAQLFVKNNLIKEIS